MSTSSSLSRVVVVGEYDDFDSAVPILREEALDEAVPHHPAADDDDA